MGKGAQQFKSSHTSTQQQVVASTSYGRDGKAREESSSTAMAMPMSTAKTTTMAMTRGGHAADEGEDDYDISLVNGRTGGGLPEGEDDASRAAIAERRLLETQQVLVQERLARDVTEAILAETAKALSAVRRAAADGGGATSVGVPLRGGGEEAAALLTEKLSLLRADYDALRGEALQKDKVIERMKREVTQLEEGYERVESGRPVTVNFDIREMTNADQDELVMASKVLLDRARLMERSVEELREVDERRVRTIAEMVSTMEARQAELKDKLRDAGLLDEGEYDDDKVGELGREGLMQDWKDKEKLGHMATVEVTYDGPATSPLVRGKGGLFIYF